MYGTQAQAVGCSDLSAFENDVKMYGTQASNPRLSPPIPFENDVKMYGTQAYPLNITF